MQSVVRDLERLRRTGRLLLVTQRGSVVAAGIVVAVLLLVLLDYVFRFPGPLRLALLLGGLAALGWSCWTFLGPALRFSPDLTALALRVERAVPTLRGRLASSVEFAGTGLDATNPLAARVVEETRRRADGAMVGMLQPRRTLAAAGALVVAALIGGGAAAMAPETAKVGLARLFAPLADNPWPSRTRVESAVPDGVRARGPAFPLRARVTLGDPDQRVTASYRMEEKESMGPWRSVVLTPQGAGSGDPALAGLHERLVESDADAIEFSFATVDFESPVQRIEFIPPPAVRRATLVAQPPSHAAHRPPVEVELGDGTDDRGTAAPALLEGSTARIELELAKPVPVPDPIDADWADWLAATLASSKGPAPVPSLRVDPTDATRWTISWRADAPLDLLLRLQDEHGIANLSDIVYRVAVAADAMPSASILEPEVDETVAPGALVPILAEARDDVGVAGLVVEVERRRGERTEVLAPLTSSPIDPAQPPAALGLEASLDLAALESLPGDIYTLQAVATDGFELDGVRHDPARSTRRTLRVVEESDLGEQLRRQLAALRQSAMRIDAQQADVAAEVAAALDAASGAANGAASGVAGGAEQAAPGEAPGRNARDGRPNRQPDGPLAADADRRQTQVGERLNDQRTALDAVARRLTRNRVDDAELAATLELARDHLDRAGEASNEAAEALRRAQESQQTGERSGASRGDRSRDAGGEGRSSSGEQGRQGQAGQQGEAGQEGQQGESGQQGQQGQQGRSGQQAPQPPEPSVQPADQERPTAEERTATEARAEAQQAQAEVRDELAELIELLNRDADAWSLTRQVEKLAEQVRQLERDTARLGQRTVGRDRSELPAAEQTELERIAGAQRDAAERSRDLTENLEQRAQRQETQPDSDSGVLRQAARTAEQENLAEELDEAGRQVEANRMQNAQASQAAARRTLERMLQDLREGRRAQSRELQRQLASLIESITRLVQLQEDEIAALAAAPAGDGEQEALEQRSRSMIRLNQNTDGVIDDARRAGRGAERIARVLALASTEQGSAVGALRARPAQRDQAATHEDAALEHLREALTLAEQAQQRAEEEEAQERREALLRRYRDAQDTQRGLLEEAQELARAGNQGRRALLEAKRLGGMQQKLRESIAAIRDESEDVTRSLVFTRAHASIDAASRGAEEALAGGDSGPRTTAPQSDIVESLGAMIAALEEDAPDEQPFEDQQQAQEEEGGGGQDGQGGAPPLIPPRSELKLLRSLQEQLLRQTRMLGEAGLEGEALGDAARELGRRQRELADLAQQMLEALGGGEGGPPQGGPQGGPQAGPQAERPAERPAE